MTKIKSFYIYTAMSLIIAMSFSQTGCGSGHKGMEDAAAATDKISGVASNEKGKADVLDYPLKGADLPSESTPLTFDEINNLIKEKDVYSWMSKPVFVPIIDIKMMRTKKITENTDVFGEESNSLLHQAKALSLVVEGESAQMRGELVRETRRVLEAINTVLCGIIGDTVNKTLSEGSDFTDLEEKVKADSGYVDGTHMEHHGAVGIKVKLKLNHISQRWEMYEMDGSLVKDFQYAISTGRMGGLQIAGTTKAYAIAYARKDGEYSILVCPDVEASPLRDGLREISLNLMAVNLSKEAVKSLLGAPPFNLGNETIERLFAPNEKKGGIK